MGSWGEGYPGVSRWFFKIELMQSHHKVFNAFINMTERMFKPQFIDTLHMIADPSAL